MGIRSSVAEHPSKSSLWYSVIPIVSDGKEILINVFTTHKDDIEKLEAKYSIALKNYEKNIDNKFS